MKRVVLYNPLTVKGKRLDDISLALLAISKILDKEGYDIKIIDNFDKNRINKILEYCKSATCFALTIMTGYQIKDGLKIAKIVKTKYPKIAVVWGGWHPSILPNQTIKNKYVDIIVKSQGEKTFTALIHALEKNKSLKNILGITYKKDNKIITNQERKPEPLDNFLPLPYHLIDKNKVIVKSDFASRTARYVSSQGCPHRCGFCSELLVYKRRWNALSANRVIQDLKLLVNKYKANGIIFTDTNFFVDEKRVKEICKGILKNKLKFKWGGINGRADTLLKYSNETWDLLKKAGLYSILVGAESGLQETLDLVNKDSTVQDMIDFTKKCHKYGFKIEFSFILGLPHDSVRNPKEYKKYIKKEFNSIVDFFLDTLKIEKNHKYWILIYAPYPGCPLYQKSLKFGLKEPKSLEEWSNFESQSKNVPWVPDKYVKLINHFQIFYFPFLTNAVYNRILNFKRFKKISLLIYKIFHFLAEKRLKHRFFLIPIEYYILKIAHILVYLKWKYQTK